MIGFFLIAAKTPCQIEAYRLGSRQPLARRLFNYGKLKDLAKLRRISHTPRATLI